jgi:hypothetical protein
MKGFLFAFTSAVAVVGSITAAQADSGNAVSDEIGALRQELDAQRALTRKLEKRLDALAAAKTKSTAKTNAQPAAEASTSATNTAEAGVVLTNAGPNALSAGYENGFYIKDTTWNNTLYINGLLQARFSHFAPNGTPTFGAIDQVSNNFDIFLGRLYFSGNIIDPSIQYFYTLQSTTESGGTGVTLLDAKMSKTFSPFLTLTAGRFWSSYTYEYYVDIAKYLLPDLSAAEWAFSLGRIIGAQASGQADKLSYSVSVSNSVPGSDVSSVQNTKSQFATIVHANYDILEPYGYKETDPNAEGVSKPQLSLWASGMYNVVAYPSTFQNQLAGDKTYWATASLNFRYGYLSFQGSGYFKGTEANSGGWAPHPAFDSYGWQEQIGYYIIPGTLELAERIDAVNWGRGQIPFSGGSENQWFAGPGNFSYSNLTEYTGGINYYFHGHNAKVQLAYSYLTGVETQNLYFQPSFNSQYSNGHHFNAQRVILQTQLAF